MSTERLSHKSTRRREKPLPKVTMWNFLCNNSWPIEAWFCLNVLQKKIKETFFLLQPVMVSSIKLLETCSRDSYCFVKQPLESQCCRISFLPSSFKSRKTLMAKEMAELCVPSSAMNPPWMKAINERTSCITSLSSLQLSTSNPSSCSCLGRKKKGREKENWKCKGDLSRLPTLKVLKPGFLMTS